MELSWMPLYIDKFLAGTDFMDSRERGGYLLLLIEQFKKGFVPNDRKMLKRISGLEDEQLEVVLSKFVPCESGLINSVGEQIRNTQIAKYEKRSNANVKNARKRYQSQDDGCANGMRMADESHTERREEKEESTVQHQQQHRAFTEKILSDEAELDREKLEVQLHKKITRGDLQMFCAHLHTQERVHTSYSEFLSHFRNWLNTNPAFKFSSPGRGSPAKSAVTKSKSEQILSAVEQAKLLNE